MFRIVEENSLRRILFIYSSDELKFKISNIAFSQGDVARVHDNYGHDLLEGRSESYMHQWKDVCEDGNWERAKSLIKLSIGELEQILYKFTARKLPDAGISFDNDTSVEDNEYVIELKVSRTFSEGSAEYMMNLCEEFIVDSVLENWALITYPEAAQIWGALKADTANKIRHVSHYNMARPSVAPSPI